MGEVEKLCDRVGIIHEGRLLAEGTVPELRVRTGQPDLEEIFVQLVAAPFRERALFRAAAFLEARGIAAFSPPS